jgi:DNA-binding beta-propeller fold protein YncE
VADTGNNAIRKITPDGSVSTLAGDGLAGDKDGKGAGAQFNGPIGIAVDAAGNVYVADTYNDRIRRIAPDGTVTTIAGGQRAGMADGAAAQALFDTPTGLASTPMATSSPTRPTTPSASWARTAMSAPSRPPRTTTAMLLRSPVGIALTKDGFLYIASSARPRGADHAAGRRGGAAGCRPSGPAGLWRRWRRAPVFAARHGAGQDGSLFVTDGATFRLHHIEIVSGDGSRRRTLRAGRHRTARP